MGGKGGIVAASVFHVQDQRNVQDLGLQRCIGTVRAQDM